MEKSSSIFDPSINLTVANFEHLLSSSEVVLDRALLEIWLNVSLFHFFEKLGVKGLEESFDNCSV